MECLDALVEYAHDCSRLIGASSGMSPTKVARYAKEIEDEVARATVALPKDMHGEPIRPGDEVVTHYPFGDARRTVRALVLTDRWDFELSDEPGDTRDVADVGDFLEMTEHVEPCVEDVLRDFTDKVVEWCRYSGTVTEESTWASMAKPFIDRLQLKGEE